MRLGNCAVPTGKKARSPITALYMCTLGLHQFESLVSWTPVCARVMAGVGQQVFVDTLLEQKSRA